MVNDKAFGRGNSFVVFFVMAMDRVDVVDLVVDLVDVDLDVDLVDVDLDVDLVDVDLDVDLLTLTLTLSLFVGVALRALKNHDLKNLKIELGCFR